MEDKIGKEEHRDLLKQIAELEKERQEDGTYRDEKSIELSRVLVGLMEDSDFGRHRAKKEFYVPSRYDGLASLEAIDKTNIDGLLIQGINLGHELLGRFGKVSVAPYSRGINTMSGMYEFVPMESQND